MPHPSNQSLKVKRLEERKPRTVVFHGWNGSADDGEYKEARGDARSYLEGEVSLMIVWYYGMEVVRTMG